MTGVLEWFAYMPAGTNAFDCPHCRALLINTDPTLQAPFLVQRPAQPNERVVDVVSAGMPFSESGANSIYDVPDFVRAILRGGAIPPQNRERARG